MLKTITEKQRNAGSESAALIPSARWALTSLSLSMLMPSLDTSIANAGLPTLAASLDASFQEVQWIVLAYLLAITALIVSVRRLGDLVGRRRLLLSGIALFTAASLVCGAAPSLWVLVAARAVQGLGAAVMMSLTVALVGTTVSKAKTGGAMGLLGTMSAIGTTLGPSLGGLMVAGLGWRIIFLINVPVGVLNFALAHRYLPADLPVAGKRPGFDVLGTVVLALTLAGYALSMTTGGGRFGPANLALFAAALLGVGVFVVVENRSGSPLIRWSMIRDPELASRLAMSTLVSTVIMATLVVGPFYLSEGLALGSVLVGLSLSVGPLVAALAGVPAGRIVDRFGARPTTFAGLTGMAAGAAVVAVMPASYGVAGYLAPIVVVTGSYALFQTANNTGMMTNILPEQRGVVSGMMSLSRNLGLITGASVIGAVFAFASGAADHAAHTPAAVAFGARTTFVVASSLTLAALLIAVAARAIARRPVRHHASAADTGIYDGKLAVRA